MGLKKLQFALFVDSSRTVVQTVGKKYENQINFFFHTKANSNVGLKKLQFALFVDACRTVTFLC